MIGRWQGILQSTTLEKRMEDAEAELNLMHKEIHNLNGRATRLKSKLAFLKNRILKSKEG